MSYDLSFCIWLKRKTTFLSIYCCLLGYSEVKWYRNSLHACQCWLYSNSSEEPFRLILFCSLSRISQSCIVGIFFSAERYNLSFFLPYRKVIFVICLKDCLSFARDVCHWLICQRGYLSFARDTMILSVIGKKACLSFVTEAVCHYKRDCQSFAERLTFIW